MAAPKVYKIPDLQHTALANSGDASGMNDQTLNNSTSSSSLTTVGPSATEHLSNSQALQDDLDQLSQMLANDPDAQNDDTRDKINKVSTRVTTQPLDGAATLLMSIMNSTGFKPWNLPTQYTDGADPQLPKFQAFLDKVAAFDQVFVLKESEVKVLANSHTDFSALISAVKNLVTDAVGVAEAAGTAVATDGADSGDLTGAGKQIIDSIANIVNVASTKDNYEESSSLCLANVFHVDDAREESEAFTVSFFYSFLHLVKDTHCGKTTRQENMVVAYAKFGFLTRAWADHYAQVALQYDITSFNQMYNALQTPQDNSKAVNTPGWNQAVGPYNTRSPQDDMTQSASPTD